MDADIHDWVDAEDDSTNRNGGPKIRGFYQPNCATCRSQIRELLETLEVWSKRQFSRVAGKHKLSVDWDEPECQARVYIENAGYGNWDELTEAIQETNALDNPSFAIGGEITFSPNRMLMFSVVLFVSHAEHRNEVAE